MIAQEHVELGAEPFDGAPALVIEEVRAKLHCDATELFEGVLEQQQLTFGIERGTLNALAIPSGADLSAAMRELDVHVRRHSDRLPVGIEDRKRQHRPVAL